MTTPRGTVDQELKLKLRILYSVDGKNYSVSSSRGSGLTSLVSRAA